MGAAPLLLGAAAATACRGTAACSGFAAIAVAHSPDLPASLAGFLVLEDFATPEEVRQLKERGEELVSWLAGADNNETAGPALHASDQPMVRRHLQMPAGSACC